MGFNVSLTCINTFPFHRYCFFPHSFQRYLLYWMRHSISCYLLDVGIIGAFFQPFPSSTPQRSTPYCFTIFLSSFFPTVPPGCSRVRVKSVSIDSHRFFCWQQQAISRQMSAGQAFSWLQVWEVGWDSLLFPLCAWGSFCLDSGTDGTARYGVFPVASLHLTDWLL